MTLLVSLFDYAIPLQVSKKYVLEFNVFMGYPTRG
jgi:hypothetical protein